MDTTQQLHLGIGRIFQRNQIGWNITGYSTLLTHTFHLFTHGITSATIVTFNRQLLRNKPVLIKERQRLSLACKVIILQLAIGQTATRRIL
jgi:hypothetical protein